MARTRNDELFKVKTIQFCIEFLWSFYFWKIFWFVFLPYVLFFITFFVYSTVIYEGKIEGFKANYILGSVCIAFSIYTLIMEVREMFKVRAHYFTATALLWNIVSIASAGLVLTFSICDFCKVDPVKMRDIAAIATFFLWLNLFYFLRIFVRTSAFIRMITEIIKDMGVFSFIYLLAMVAFANSIFILDGGFSTVPGLERVAGN